MKFFKAAVEMARTIRISPDERQERLRVLRDAERSECLYYRALDAIVDNWGPLDVIEIGTYVGTSAAHLAVQNYNRNAAIVFGKVITIDINPDAAGRVRDLGFNNIYPVTGDSHAMIDRVTDMLAGDLVDILYIDGNHTFAHAWGEYYLYRQLVREGGLILFDDVGLPMDGDEMNVLWDLIPEPKERVDHLHPGSGFGIVEKRNHVVVPTPAQASDLSYAPIMAKRMHRA